MHSIIKFTRRKFLQVSPIAVLSPSLFTGKIIKEGQKEQKIDSRNILNYHPDMLYRKLGNTDIHLSVLSLGGGGLKEAVAHYCIDRGVNLIHMSDHYNRGNSIKELGKVLKTKSDYEKKRNLFYPYPRKIQNADVQIPPKQENYYGGRPKPLSSQKNHLMV